ncbi:MAG: UDP-3-O-(3-hydroxymyristoyl)glucosamine N-acyltransferase [Sporomusaceae bacterium]|nr:UDP-3-O-(3-hydroxymyristoyl)glucosamine N-acyltransferase [Sporomusaceae bacterium]
MKTLQELAEVVGGTLQGDGMIEIQGVTNLEDAKETDITFAVAPHLEKAALSQAGAVMIPPEAADTFPKAAIVVDNPRVAFTKLLELFFPPVKIEAGVHPTAVVGKNVILGENVAIMPYAVIADNVKIGDHAVIYPHTYVGHGTVIGANTVLYPSVTIREYCQIGSDCIIHANTVIGSDGFGFVTVKGKHEKVPQVGNVKIGDRVEIGSNVAVDRATTGSTIISSGTKIDNFVHIAHNVVVGEDGLFVAFTGIAGSAKIGNHVTFAGQSGCNGHINIGDNCTFAARSAPIKDVPAGSFFAGFPARPHREWLRAEAAIQKLPDLMKQVKDLERKIRQLEERP